MADPYFSSNRRETLATSAVQAAAFDAVPGMLHPIDMSAAAGNLVVSFPAANFPGNIEAAEFGVLVIDPHETHRVTFDLNGESFAGDAEAVMTAFQLGDDGSDRAEFLVFKRIAGSWYVVSDGRSRAA
jgi:hypothetical protein